MKFIKIKTNNNDVAININYISRIQKVIGENLPFLVFFMNDGNEPIHVSFKNVDELDRVYSHVCKSLHHVSIQLSEGLNQEVI